MRSSGTAIAVSLTALVASTLTVAITRAPRPQFDRLLFGLEGDGLVTLQEPGLPDGDYRVPVGTRCRLYRLYARVNIIQIEDGRLAYANDHEILDDTPANRKLLKELSHGRK